MNFYTRLFVKTLAPSLTRLALAVAVTVTVGCAPRLPAVAPAGLGLEHPLVGRIWSPEHGEFISQAKFVELLVDARIVLLGEQHHNPDHHRFQGWALQQMSELGRRPVVVFEMIERDQQQAVDSCRSSGRCGLEELAEATSWNERGWPDWRIYAPVLDQVVRNDLVVVAGSLERSTVREVARSGRDAIEPALRQSLGLDRPIDPADREAMIEEIRDSHCGHAPSQMLDGMVEAQRLRDAFMASQLASAQVSTTTVLVAGNGHTREDRGVPAHLALMAPHAEVLAVAFVEVSDDVHEPAEYAAYFDSDELPFDAVWFTARMTDEDPCEQFREQLRKMKNAAKDDQPSTAKPAP